jgi:hypothetical protein
MDDNYILSIIAIIVSVSGVIISIINHKQIRSKCLSEKEMVISLDIENTSPKKELKIVVPPEVDNYNKELDLKIKK